MEFSNPVPQIVGQKVAGEAAKTRKELEKVIKFSNGSMFEIAELLFKIKKNGFYEGFTTFNEYIKSLNFKRRRLEYLTKMAEVMDTVGIPREQYEPLGLSKMRAITRLDPSKEWVNPEDNTVTPISAFIKGLVEKGQAMPLEEIHNHVDTLQGKVGAESMVWLHLYLKTQAMEQVVRPALELAKAQIGSVSKDSEGISKDASDGSALTSICADYLADPNNEVGLEYNVEDNVGSEQSVS